MIDQAAFTRMLRRLNNFDRDDFAEVASKFKAGSMPGSEWNMCQSDPVGYFLANGRAIQDEMFKILLRSESAQMLVMEQK